MYNGWKNYETWNVALWISNDPGLYAIAKDCNNYTQLKDIIWDHTGHSSETPDEISFNDVGLDTEALDSLVRSIS